MQPLWKTVEQFLKKLKILKLPYYPEILLLGTYVQPPFQTLIQEDTHTPMFIAMLWMQPKCLL